MVYITWYPVQKTELPGGLVQVIFPTVEQIKAYTVRSLTDLKTNKAAGWDMRNILWFHSTISFVSCIKLLNITVFFDIGCATSGVKTQLSGMRRDLDNQSWSTLETWAATAQMVRFKSHDCKQMVPTSHGNWSKKSSTHFYCYSTARM